MAICAALTFLSADQAYARADYINYAPTCSASIDSVTADADFTSNPPPWNCSETDFTSGDPVTYLRFSASEWQESEPPVNFFTRISRFKSITLSVRDADGWTESITYRPEDAQPIAAGPIFTLELPEIGPDTSEVIAEIEGPHSVTMLSEARLSSTPEGAEWTQINVMLLVLERGLSWGKKSGA